MLIKLNKCYLQGSSSIGRVAVSKTVGCGFESCLPCQKNKGFKAFLFFVKNSFANILQTYKKQSKINNKNPRTYAGGSCPCCDVFALAMSTALSPKI